MEELDQESQEEGQVDSLEGSKSVSRSIALTLARQTETDERRSKFSDLLEDQRIRRRKKKKKKKKDRARVY